MEQERLLISGLRKNRKGVVISIDAMAAVFIAAVILAVAYNNISPRDNLPQIAMTRLGGDIVSVLDYQNIFDTLDENLIETRMNELLPQNYGMRITVDCGGAAEAGNPVPSGTTVGSGRIFFVKGSDNCETRYWIWQR